MKRLFSRAFLLSQLYLQNVPFRLGLSIVWKLPKLGPTFFHEIYVFLATEKKKLTKFFF